MSPAPPHFSSSTSRRFDRIPSVSPDIYNWDMRYRSVQRRLHAEDSGILEANRLTVKKFLETREARGLSLPRVIKYGNHLITFSKLCLKPFEEMTQDDMREVLVSLKNGNKMDPRFTKRKNEDGRAAVNGSSKYSEATIDGFKIMIKIFWRWLKGMDESEPTYPPEVNWIKAQSLHREGLPSRARIFSRRKKSIYSPAPRVMPRIRPS